MQKAHGEDLVQLNGGSGSSKNLVWGHRAQQNRSEQDPANNAIPMQPSYIQFAASGESAQDVEHITRDVVIIMRPIRRAEERRTRSRLQLRRVSGRPVQRQLQ